MRHIKNFFNWWAISLGVGTVSTIIGFANLHTVTGYSALTVTALTISIFGSLGIHELGHTIAGFAVKFRFKVFAIGPFAISKDEANEINKRLVQLLQIVEKICQIQIASL